MVEASFELKVVLEGLEVGGPVLDVGVVVALLGRIQVRGEAACGQTDGGKECPG